MIARWTIVAVLLSGLATVPVNDTHDGGQKVHADIAYALAAVPGGVVLDPWHAVWPDGMEIQVPHPGSRAVLNCPTARVCAFDDLATSGTMLSWSTCGTFSTSGLFQVKSIANARSDGILQARNGLSVLATANAGTSKNVTGDVDNVRCLE